MEPSISSSLPPCLSVTAQLGSTEAGLASGLSAYSSPLATSGLRLSHPSHLLILTVGWWPFLPWLWWSHVAAHARSWCQGLHTPRDVTAQSSVAGVGGVGSAQPHTYPSPVHSPPPPCFTAHPHPWSTAHPHPWSTAHPHPDSQPTPNPGPQPTSTPSRSPGGLRGLSASPREPRGHSQVETETSN